MQLFPLPALLLILSCRESGADVNVSDVQYADYMLTCPLLTLDLMWTLNLPYKVCLAMS